jgi:hypothetical protein
MTENIQNDLPLLSEQEERIAKTMMILTPDSDNDSLLLLGQYLAAFTPVKFLGNVPRK